MAIINKLEKEKFSADVSSPEICLGSHFLFSCFFQSCLAAQEWKQKKWVPLGLKNFHCWDDGWSRIPKGSVARESTLGASHVGRIKVQWLGNNSREARERPVMGSRKSPAVKTEPRKNKIVVSEGQHS